MKLQESLDKVEQHLSKLDNQSFDRISFRWENIPFNAVVEKASEGLSHIKLDAKLGRLFYTIENAELRTAAVKCLYSTNRKTDASYKIAKNGEVFFHSLTKTSKTLAGKNLMEAITVILLQSGSQLQLLNSQLKS
ncbi:hypothetical protein [Kordiimonas aquimaris]|uniref:hypothetical protein n=1 Tax=Kordiimonas aquimaris TaxID=707591 RepID=UPI0021CF9A24|nr:hypothetical protein [Kordiimonas aquimaris]